ncbi:metallophosphoesterase [Kocuria palustris]|uniref:metallophosphoesterase n=1 Tax=Kocuria palustris TaxID=71999 RepID=UPI0011AAC59B|nr:metallophosphoesterase [Kocuria palustris]
MPTTSMSRPDDQRPAPGQVREVRLGRTALRPDSELFDLDPASERQAGAVEVQRADGILLDTGPCHDLPYVRASVRLAPGRGAEAVWSGTAPEGRSVSLWAQQTGDAGSWRMLARAEGRGGRRIELRAQLPPELLHRGAEGDRGAERADGPAGAAGAAGRADVGPGADGPAEVRLLVLGEDDFAAPVREAEAGFADPEDYDFAIVHLTDTQYLAEGAAQTRDPQKRERFQAAIDAITDWIEDSAGTRRIVYLAHTGDVVQNWCWWWDRRAVAEREFAAASEMFERFERIGLPWGVLPGNHDNRWGSDDQDGGAAPELSLYNRFFGPQRLRDAAGTWAPSAGDAAAGAPRVTAQRGRPWRPEDASCHYDLLTIGSVRLLMLHLGYGVDDEQIAWANDVLQEHSDRDAILCTHHFLDRGTRPDGSGAPWGGPRSFGPDDGLRIQEGIVARNANVVLVLSGHISGTGWRVERSDPVHPTTAVLADYQSHRLPEPAEEIEKAADGHEGEVSAASGADGGAEADPVAAAGERRTGFLRLLQFRAEAGEVRITTYSPLLDSFDPDAHAPAEQLEQRRSGAREEPEPPGGWADPHQLVLPVSLRSRTTWLQTDRLGADAAIAAPAPAAAPAPGEAGGGESGAAQSTGLGPSEDAHGVVRPDRWGAVLTAAGALAVRAMMRGLRRR